MMRIAVLRNPKSSKNIARPAPAYPPSIAQFELDDAANLPALLQKLHQDTLDLLVIDGGDGTVRQIVTHLPGIFTTHMPLLGILANGNTNLIARSLGREKPPASLDELARTPRHEVAAASVTMRLLRLDFEHENRACERGFITGWGAYATATKIAVEEIAKRGEKQVTAAILKTLTRAFFAQDAAKIRHGVEMGLTIDNTAAWNGMSFIGLATTLNGPLTAGFNPFWGKGDNPIRLTTVEAPAKYLPLALPFALFGRPMPWMQNAGYRSDRCNDIELQISDDLILDGEKIEIGVPQKIAISARERLQFIPL